MKKYLILPIFCFLFFFFGAFEAGAKNCPIIIGGVQTNIEVPDGMDCPEEDHIESVDLINDAMPPVDSGEGIFNSEDCCLLKNRVKVGNGVLCDKGMSVAADESSALLCPGPYCGQGQGNPAHWWMFCLIDKVYTVTNWIFVILLSVAGLMIIYGGFLLVTSGGDAQKTVKSRNIIIFAIVGVVVAFLSRAVPEAVKLFLRF